MKIIFVIILSFIYLPGIDNLKVINKNINDVKKIEENNNQKNIYRKQIKNKLDIKENKIFNALTKEESVNLTDSNCLMIHTINIENSSVFTNKDFALVKKPYLNTCNGLKRLSILVQKISNMYIKNGYVTSRAYLKAQDLSKGVVTISILEGKIENVVNEKKYTKNLYSTNDLLNMRDLEVAIQQVERLRSQ